MIYLLYGASKQELITLGLSPNLGVRREIKYIDVLFTVNGRN